ncbi:MAG: hypothetical protein OXB88_11450 [Bacteriovoracales bacterium]|nr:hypothetical protein [Bacteriovoracales bacterium]
MKKSKGTKHANLLDFDRYFEIHFNVIKKFHWIIKSGDRSYRIDSDFDENAKKEVKFDINFNTVNNYHIEIFKIAQITTLGIKKLVKTKSFTYNCFQKIDHKKILQYHSPHAFIYFPKSPWHNRVHRHEFIGRTQKIDIYSTDHRPQSEKRNRYTWKEGPVRLNFLGHENWPHVHEFLQEVSKLPMADF